MESNNSFALPPDCVTLELSDGLANDWPEERPLCRELVRPEPFPVAALGSSLAPAVSKCAEVIMAPPAICAFSFLAAVNLAVQAHANVLIDGRVMPISEFFVSVAGSGERKTAVDAEALYPHREWQRSVWQVYEIERGIYEDDKEVYDSLRRSILSKNKAQSDKRKALSDLKPPTEPVSPVLIMSEPTYEGLVKQLSTGHPSAGLFSDEGGRFLGGHAMTEEHQLKTVTGLSSLWDRGDIDRVRSGDGASMHFGKRLSLHLMLQPEVSTLLLANRRLKDQGFLSRCLVVRPDFVRKAYNPTDLSTEPSVIKYRARARDILDVSLPLKEGSRNVLDPRTIKLVDKAKAKYAQFHDWLQARVGPNERFDSIRGFANKAHDHTARIAATLALFEDIHCKEVTLDQFERAQSIVEHCIHELLRLIDAHASDEKLMEAQTLLAWLLKRKKHLISLVEMYRVGPNFVRSASKAATLMDVLCEHGFARPSNESVDFEGVLRKTVWEIRLS